MSKVLVCDRCGKKLHTYDDFQPTPTTCSVLVNVQDPDLNGIKTRIDLCPDCAAGLIDFLNINLNE